MGTIICLGDSLTYGYGVRRAQCWTELAAEMSGWNVVNRGICGDTTGGMLVRLREILREEIGQRNERCFLLMGGCNDIFFSGSSTGARENMAAMAHQLFAEGEMPLIAVGPGIADGSYPSMWSDLVDFPEAGTDDRLPGRFPRPGWEHTNRALSGWAASQPGRPPRDGRESGKGTRRDGSGDDESVIDVNCGRNDS